LVQKKKGKEKPQKPQKKKKNKPNRRGLLAAGVEGQTLARRSFLLK